MVRIIRLFFNFGISYDHFAEQAFPLVLQSSNVQFLYTAMRDTWVEWNVALKHFNGCYCDILFYFFALSPPSSAYSWHFPTITLTIIIIYPSTKKYHSRGRNFITSLNTVVMAAGSGEKGHLGDKGTFTTNDVVVRQEVKMGLPIRLIW